MLVQTSQTPASDFLPCLLQLFLFSPSFVLLPSKVTPSMDNYQKIEKIGEGDVDAPTLHGRPVYYT